MQQTTGNMITDSISYISLLLDAKYVKNTNLKLMIRMYQQNAQYKR